MDKEYKVKNNQIPDFILTLLKQRGIEDKEEVKRFLYPKLTDLRSPSAMLNSDSAAACIEEYIKNDLQIIIWGDYDVDGTTGTALLVNFFAAIGVDVLWHIPNRLKEGYGMNTAWINEHLNEFKSKNFLVITVDSGISNRDEIAEIYKMGGEVIVTDHHSIPEKGIPKCIVINPEQKECGFHRDKIAGVGVAFYLAAAIKCHLEKQKGHEHIKEIKLKHFLSFVAIGTVADMVPVTHINRILVRAGMEELEKPKFAGLKALLHQAEIHNGNISSEDIGFQIGPKINAAGRLGNSKIVVEILTSQNQAEAAKLAKQLEELNNKRKNICERDTETAFLNISPYQVEQDGVCIVYGNFHFGVAGIVASKLVEKYACPAIVLGEDQDKNGMQVYRGSGRSIEGINLVQLLKDTSVFLEHFGGHSMAVGLTLKKENIEKFVKLAKEVIKVERQKNKINPMKSYDLLCSIDTAMSYTGLHFLNLLEPFGPGNPQPKFLDNQSIIINSKKVGRSLEHLNITLRGKYSSYKGIGFGLGKYINEIQEQPQRKLCYSITKNRYRRTESWQVRVLSL